MTARERAHVVASPTATIHASPDIVWTLLTEPATYSRWAGRVLRVEPPGAAHPGQRIELRERALGVGVRVRVDVVAVQESPRRLRLEVHLPLGILRHEVVSCAALGADAAFVSFNRDFELPPGWRGTAVRLLFGRALRDGPARQLDALRREAEAIAHEHAHAHAHARNGGHSG